MGHAKACAHSRQLIIYLKAVLETFLFMNSKTFFIGHAKACAHSRQLIIYLKAVLETFLFMNSILI